MKLITQYRNNDALSEDIDIYLLAIEQLASHQPDSLSVKKICEAIGSLHQHQKLAYLHINRFLFEPDLPSAIEMVKEVIAHQIDGIIVNDFGWLLTLQELEFDKPIILQTDTTITNRLEIQCILEEGFHQVVLARELTLDEIKEISSLHRSKIIVPIFGHQIMSTSRRMLLDAYGQEINQTFESYRFYNLQESTRQEPYLIYQDESGTHIFDGCVLAGFEELDSLIESGCEYFLLDNLHLPTEMINLAANYFKQIEQGACATKLCELYQQTFDQIVFTKALWNKKTTDKKVTHE